MAGSGVARSGGPAGGHDESIEGSWSRVLRVMGDRAHLRPNCWPGTTATAGSAHRSDLVGEVVDADRHREDQRIVLAWSDRHPVALADPEPALGDVGDRDAVTSDLVLMVQDVALRLQRTPAGQVDGEPVPKRVDDGLPDRGDPLIPAFDRHRVAGPQQPLLELDELVAVGVFAVDGVAHP